VSFVNDPHRDLAGNVMVALDELPLESHYINVLQKPKTKGVVHLEERPNHRMGEPFFNELANRHALKIALKNPQKPPNPRHRTQKRDCDRSE